MTGSEADRLSARMALHLCKNRFEQCHNILDEAEAQSTAENHKCHEERKTPLAELDLDVRVVNTLEKSGYVYVEDLGWQDPRNLAVPNLGEKGKRAIQCALDRHYKAKRLKKKELEEEKDKEAYQIYTNR